jgi:hypothetical protein
VKRGVDPADIIRGAENYAAYVRQHLRDSQFVKTAAGWLKDERWTEYQQAPEPPRLRAGMV